jgi:hypothetical protein
MQPCSDSRSRLGRVGKITGLGAKTTIKRLYSEAKRALRRVKLD